MAKGLSDNRRRGKGVLHISYLVRTPKNTFLRTIALFYGSFERFIVWVSGTPHLLEQISAKRKNKINHVLLVQKNRQLVAIEPTKRQIFSTINDATDQSRDGERLFNNEQQRIFLKWNLTSWNNAVASRLMYSWTDAVSTDKLLSTFRINMLLPSTWSSKPLV